MGISIFAQPAHTNTNPAQPFDPSAPVRSGHLQRVSSIIRGEQIAERLGARLNPFNGYFSDVCIYVKPHVNSANRDEWAKTLTALPHPYLDIIDGWGLVPLLQACPGVGVIACSRQDGEMLRGVLSNPVTVIPQHHANFDRVKRTREGIARVGVIGVDKAFPFLPEGLGPALAQRGIELETFSKFYTRADIVAFYSRIDVQIVWRPYRMRLSNPLKLVNAASFGVPTIALRESTFDELGDACLQVGDLVGLLAKLDELRQWPLLYEQLSARCLHRAEAYHIDAVCDMYRRLQ